MYNHFIIQFIVVGILTPCSYNFFISFFYNGEYMNTLEIKKENTVINKEIIAKYLGLDVTISLVDDVIKSVRWKNGNTTLKYYGSFKFKHLSDFEKFDDRKNIHVYFNKDCIKFDADLNMMPTKYRIETSCYTRDETVLREKIKLFKQYFEHNTSSTILTVKKYPVKIYKSANYNYHAYKIEAYIIFSPDDIKKILHDENLNVYSNMNVDTVKSRIETNIFGGININFDDEVTQ